jgi:type I restriction enzyme S subunit
MIQEVPGRYDFYDEHEIEWLPQNKPRKWMVKRIKDLAVLQSGNSIISEQIEEDGQYPVYGGNGLRGYYSKYTNNGEHILIGRQGALCGNINYASGKFWASEHAVVVYLNRLASMKWFGEMLKVMNLNQYSLSAAQPGLAMDRIKRLLVPVPCIQEQKAISDFLDRKIVQIDQKIDLLTQKAKHFGQLKRSLINETVTRGLDKTVAMKDSSVEWIGEVPAHWDVQRIGTAFEERSEKVNDTDYPPLSVSMGGIVPQMESVAKTDNNENRKRVAVGDYVINSRSDRRGASGISIYDGSVSVISIVLAPRRSFFGKYLHHLFRSYSFIEEFYRVGRGIVDDLWTTRYSVMKSIEFACPSYDEQEIIAYYLDEKTAQIDLIIETINTQTDTLKELRKTLINDVVTGKIKVMKEGQTA